MADCSVHKNTNTGSCNIPLADRPGAGGMCPICTIPFADRPDNITGPSVDPTGPTEDTPEVPVDDDIDVILETLGLSWCEANIVKILITRRPGEGFSEVRRYLGILEDIESDLET